MRKNTAEKLIAVWAAALVAILLGGVGYTQGWFGSYKSEKEIFIEFAGDKWGEDATPAVVKFEDKKTHVNSYYPVLTPGKALIKLPAREYRIRVYSPINTDGSIYQVSEKDTVSEDNTISVNLKQQSPEATSEKQIVEISEALEQAVKAKPKDFSEEKLEAIKDQAAQRLAYRKFLASADGEEFAYVDLDGQSGKELLLKKSIGNGTDELIAYYYDQQTGQVKPAESEPLAVGAADAGGFRGSVSANKTGGIELFTHSSGTGEGQQQIYRLKDGKLVGEKTWEGRIDLLPKNDNIEKIEWHSLAALQGASPDPKAEKAAADEEGVYTGVIKKMSAKEILDFQQKENPNPGDDLSRTQMIFIPDSPQNMYARNGGSPGFRTERITMVSLGECDEKYHGKRVKIKFDSDNTWFPSDVSVPLGQPRSSSYTIIE